VMIYSDLLKRIIKYYFITQNNILQVSHLKISQS